MAVDALDHIWSARWDGNCLVRHTPDGNEERRIAFPAKKVSSVTFGGEDYTNMYITTADGDNKAEEDGGAGALFRLNLGIRGVGILLPNRPLISPGRGDDPVNRLG